MVCLDNIWLICNSENLESEGEKKKKNAFKVVQIKFFAMHITNQIYIYIFNIYGWKFTKYLNEHFT